MTRMRQLMPLCLLVLGACVADLEIEDPQLREVCLEDATIVFSDDAASETRASLDLAPLDLDIPEDQRITLAQATLTVVNGVADLQFADHVRVSLNHLDAAEAGSLAIADADVSGTNSLVFAGDPTADLGAHLREGASEIEIAVRGELPTSRWAVLADLCFDLD